MIEDLVDKLLRSLEGSNVNEIEYEADGIRIKLVRGMSARGHPPVPAPQPVDAPDSTESGPQSHRICASMHGTFYRAPSPGEAPLVEPGHQVGEGQQIAVLEAMKMLHEVEADRSGTITEILAEDGASVEPGTVLFLMEAKDV